MFDIWRPGEDVSDIQHKLNGRESENIKVNKNGHDKISAGSNDDLQTTIYQEKFYLFNKNYMYVLIIYKHW